MEKAGFWKRLNAELPDAHVWITAGLSHFTGSPTTEEGESGAKIELVAVADNGVEALLDKLKAAEIPSIFDVFRPSLV